MSYTVLYMSYTVHVHGLYRLCLCVGYTLHVHVVHCRGIWLYEQKNLHLARTICLSYSIYNIQDRKNILKMNKEQRSKDAAA